jgi:DNA-binding HxlR family transcriptional regulator
LIFSRISYDGRVRSYGQYCAVARALDVVGDRWTLLIMRELLIAGPRRYTDLLEGLPGVATNLLSTRLKELAEAGLVTRSEAPPPIKTAIYDLAEDGRALLPALRALGLWGLRLMDEQQPGDVFRAQWLAYAPLWFTTDSDPKGPPVTIQLNAAGEKAVIELRDGRLFTRVGEVEDPDLVINGSPRAVLGVAIGDMDLQSAAERGLTAVGDQRVLRRLTPVAPGSDSGP